MAKAKAKVWLVSFEVHDSGDMSDEPVVYYTRKEIAEETSVNLEVSLRKLKVTEVK